MGMFDTFVGKCPACGKEFEAQTKLGDCTLDIIHVGDAFGAADMRLQLKDGCDCCGKDIVAVIKGGRVAEYALGNPDKVEGSWGALFDPATAEKDEEDNQQSFIDAVNEEVERRLKNGK